MPTYEYRCLDCEHKFEEIQTMSAPAIEICPKCGGKAQRHISGGAGLIFKGSGFYITDYRSDSYKSAASKDSGGASEKTTSDGGSSSSTDNKSDSSPAKSDSNAASKTATTPAPPVPSSSPAPAKSAEKSDKKKD
ncbi:MAG: zinc ribbon domain-containing protein [candidate division Zixibacteria bacterium]|nr:zinc ribbon domain-containing protein [candidate division Zixibacteria bacterium]